MSTLLEVVAAALPRLKALTQAQASRKPAPEVWSAKEILGHLIDSGVNNHVRFVRASMEDGLELPGYDQNAWVRVSGWQERPWAEVLALWQAYQMHMAQVIGRLPQESLGHTLRIGGSGPVTLGFVVEDYAAHQLHHLAQVWERAGA
ncbi:DinB family protein [Deinococcus hopiensis]|uniref:DinB superfamily protein n=1 Tax=Deinococcus hopiensis KR-140 TaxID=695939 RepID=A0A1W1VR97_9DEIO|nr:DinB family protein [Deinococcus hopiensis]SMB95793.1 DinB superfamily protein [Deinococcus hopiensis KR-140]